MIDNYNNKHLNYDILCNIKDIDNNVYFNDLDKINSKNVKINDIYEIYKHFEKEENNKNLKCLINNENQDENKNEIKLLNKNEIHIKYKIDKSYETLRIFGKKFVENNKDKCKIEYEAIYCASKRLFEYDLTESISVKSIYDEFLEITLKGINKITDMSYIFDGCTSLIMLNDISDWNTSNITNMSSIFNECYSLLSISDISKWNTSHVTDMSYMFNECSSLTSIPDISKWDVSNVKSMRNMFSGREFDTYRIIIKIFTRYIKMEYF